MEQAQENKMGTAPVLRLIIAMSLPAMFSMLIQALYNIVDSYFVAQISESALTAVSLAFPIQTLMIAVGVGTGVGINSLVARRLGEKRQADADCAASHGLLLGVFNWILFALFGVFFTKVFFGAFTDIEEIITMGTQYTSIVTICSFGLMIEVNMEKALQATGNMIYPMAFQLVGAVTNIILDPVFIFGFAFIPAMGVSGAAIATVIGQILAMLISLFVIIFKDHAVNINFRRFKPDWRIIKEIYAVGFPGIIMQAIGSVMVVGMNAILFTFPQNAVTAVAFFGVYFKLQSFVFMPVFGLNQGLMPIMGYNFGARKKQRLNSATKYGCVIALVLMGAGMLVFWLMPDVLLSIFNASADMLKIGVPGLRIISLCFLPAALGIVGSTFFQAVGKGVNSLLVSLLRQLIVLLPAAFLLAKLGVVEWVWYAFPIAEIFSLLATIVLYLRVYKRQIQNLEQEPSRISGPEIV